MVTPTVAIVGSNMMDLITYYRDRMPKTGETIFGEDFEIGFGGKGANQGVAVSRLGGKVIMVTAVGDDLFGPLVKNNFLENGISSKFIKTVPGKTSGVAPIFVDEKGRNSIFIIPGANYSLFPEDVIQAEEELQKASFLLLQLEIPLETVYYAIDMAQKLNLKVILNPAPAQELEWNKIQSVFLLAPNESELESLTGIPADSFTHIQEGASFLLEKGIKNVLVTLGEKGSALFTPQGSKEFAAYSVNSIDTTGAGDAFLGALSFFLAEGKDIDEAINLSSAYAALSTTRRGTQKSFASREEFENWLKPYSSGA